MSFFSTTSGPDVAVRAGMPPLLQVDAAGRAVGWAAEHRDALRAAVAEHGALLVRGLGLRNRATGRRGRSDGWPMS